MTYPDVNGNSGGCIQIRGGFFLWTQAFRFKSCFTILGIAILMFKANLHVFCETILSFELGLLE